MNSLDEGKSPTINVRVPANRKKQLQALADLRGDRYLSTLVQDIISWYIVSRTGEERIAVMRALRED